MNRLTSGTVGMRFHGIEGGRDGVVGLDGIQPGCGRGPQGCFAGRTLSFLGVRGEMPGSPRAGLSLAALAVRSFTSDIAYSPIINVQRPFPDVEYPLKGHFIYSLEVTFSTGGGLPTFVASITLCILSVERATSCARP